MFKKKKNLILIGIFTTAMTLHAYDLGEEKKENLKLNYEIKAGITPYERFGSKAYSERFNKGLDFGMEVYKPFEKYSIGFGGEIKRKLDDHFIKENGERLYTYYILGKWKLGETYSLVGRLGRTSQKEFDSKYYVAAGLEKRFGRVTVQLLGENTRLTNNFYDKNYTTVGLKIGYIFGDIPENTPPVPILPPQELEIPQVQEPVFKLTIEGDEITGGYEAYKTAVPEVQKENIKLMVNQLNEYDKPGILEMKAYSDNTGTKKVNVQLANERMDNLEVEFKENGLTEKVQIMKVDPEQTVKNIYKVDNDSFENRKLNRRIEVSFFEDGENTKQSEENTNK